MQMYGLLYLLKNSAIVVVAHISGCVLHFRVDTRSFLGLREIGTCTALVLICWFPSAVFLISIVIHQRVIWFRRPVQ